MHCCSGGGPVHPAPPGGGAACDPTRNRWNVKGTARRFAAAGAWAAPVAALVFVPKCPMCVAAYVLLLTGASVSLTIAETMRSGVIWTSSVAIAALVLHVSWRILRSRPARAAARTEQ